MIAALINDGRDFALAAAAVVAAGVLLVALLELLYQGARYALDAFERHRGGRQ